MAGEISLATRIEVLGAIRSRYGEASKKDKSRMLDEFVAMAGCHRKHAVRLLGQGENGSTGAVPRGRKIYGEAVREALTVVWEASDRLAASRKPRARSMSVMAAVTVFVTEKRGREVIARKDISLKTSVSSSTRRRTHS